MKKLFATTLSVLLLSISSAFAGMGMGVTLSSNSLDTDAKEDVDSNTTIDATKSVTDKFMAASIFAEYTLDSDAYVISVGIDYVPMDADIDKRTTTQSSIAGKSAAGSATTGTNSVEGTISQHMTFYVQPGIKMTEATTFYGTLGYSTADVEGKNSSLSSTNITSGRDLEGRKIGIGLRHQRGDYFFKVDYSSTDYNTVGWQTDNGTTGMADLDNKALALSMGKSF